MKSKRAVEFLGTWERMHKPTFKGVEFDIFLHEAGAKRFNMFAGKIKWDEDPLAYQKRIRNGTL
jgi:hypothetical protein